MKKDSTFTSAGIFSPPLTGLEEGDLSWVDLDSDGSLDVVLTGLNNTSPVSWVYMNEGDGNFTRVNATDLPDVSLSTLDWAGH